MKSLLLSYPFFSLALKSPYTHKTETYKTVNIYSTYYEAENYM